MPISAGFSTTCTPFFFRIAIFSAAVPLPPEMIAPAWPMRRPGGAVWPAMKDDDRLVEIFPDVGGGLFFQSAADLADHDHRFGLFVFLEQFQRFDERRADDRIAADADAGGLAQASRG